MVFWALFTKKLRKMKRKNLDILENNLGVKFKNRAWLVRALIHRSFLNETQDKKLKSNERLEFLGDAILEFIVSEWLYNQFPSYPEGMMTNLRSGLVKTESLAEICRQFKIGEYLMMSRGEQESGGQSNPTLLANTLEAFLGAFYLDQGLTTTKKFIHLHFEPLLQKLIRLGEFKDSKSLLQEKIQAQVKESPVYRSLKEKGPDHNKTFLVGIYSQKKLLATGLGKSKQEAEEKAAAAAFEKINKKK